MNDEGIKEEFLSTLRHWRNVKF